MTGDMQATIELLSKLIAFDTVSANSNLEMLSLIEAFLTERDFGITPVLDPGGTKAGLFAKLGPEGDGVLLSAHSDVVPVDGQIWTRDPFRLMMEDGKLYGRGTTDMKGFLASMLAAADKAARQPLREPLKLAISYDEEVGCVGIAHMIGHLRPAIGTPRACIVGEPTEMQVATGHKGKAGFRAICNGQAGHSAMAPEFVNALHMACDFVNALRDLQDWIEDHGVRDDSYTVPYSTVHVGQLHGGLALNMVPDRAEIAFEFRHLPGDPPEGILSRIKAAAISVATAYAARFPDASIKLDEGAAYPGLETPADAPVVKQAQALADRVGTIKVPFGTEAGFFAGLGIPTVVCGPGSMEGQGHKPDEFLHVDQLAACDAMLERLIDTLV